MAYQCADCQVQQVAEEPCWSCAGPVELSFSDIFQNPTSHPALFEIEGGIGANYGKPEPWREVGFSAF